MTVSTSSLTSSAVLALLGIVVGIYIIVWYPKIAYEIKLPYLLPEKLHDFVDRIGAHVRVRGDVGLFAREDEILVNPERETGSNAHRMKAWLFAPHLLRYAFAVGKRQKAHTAEVGIRLLRQTTSGGSNRRVGAPFDECLYPIAEARNRYDFEIIPRHTHGGEHGLAVEVHRAGVRIIAGNGNAFQIFDRSIGRIGANDESEDQRRTRERETQRLLRPTLVMSKTIR